MVSELSDPLKMYILNKGRPLKCGDCGKRRQCFDFISDEQLCRQCFKFWMKDHQQTMNESFGRQK